MIPSHFEKNIWRFTNGKVSGIVIAENEEEAKYLAGHYLQVQFDDIGLDDVENMYVWRMCDDDDFRNDYPYALAVSY